MGEEKNKQEAPQVFSGGSTGSAVQGVSGIGGMTPAERVQYIQEIQKLSPLSRIVEAVKKIKLSDLGLAKSIFNAGAEAMNSVKNVYQNLRVSQNINQPITNLTENVRGIEQLKHEIEPGANVELIDGIDIDKKKGLYIDLDWTPKKKGIVE